MSNGELFLISAPSGAGKTTLMKGVEERLRGTVDLSFVVSHTTRLQRAGEVAGVDYHFVDDTTFDRMLAADEFLEWAPVYDRRYGTSKAEVIPALERGQDVVHDLDVQGAERLRARMPEAHTIFVLPPSYQELERRLSGRASDSAAQIARRLAVSLSEIERYEQYDYVIINREVASAAEVLAAIILEKRHRRDRMREVASAIIADFRARLRPEATT